MCKITSYPDTYLPPQPCVVKEGGIQRVYKWCRGKVLAFAADEKGVRCWVEGREVFVHGIQGRPREGWSFATLERVLNAYKITPSMSADAPGAISSIGLSVRGLGGMQIFIQIIGVKCITLDVEPSDTIEMIKNKIADKIPNTPFAQVEHQELIYEGKPLEDKKTLQDYNINTQITVYLHEKSASPLENSNENVQKQARLTNRSTNMSPAKDSETINITILSLVGKEIDIDVKPSDTIEMIKNKIADKMPNTPFAQVEHHKLIYEGKPLEDKKTLKNYNIQAKATVHLMYLRTSKKHFSKILALILYIFFVIAIIVSAAILAKHFSRRG